MKHDIKINAHQLHEAFGQNLPSVKLLQSRIFSCRQCWNVGQPWWLPLLFLLHQVASSPSAAGWEIHVFPRTLQSHDGEVRGRGEGQDLKVFLWLWCCPSPAFARVTWCPVSLHFVSWDWGSWGFGWCSPACPESTCLAVMHHVPGRAKGKTFTSSFTWKHL